MVDREQIEAAIAAQERLRGVVPDEVVDAAVAALRQQFDPAVTSGFRRRRQITVLFADVSGFTRLAETMDPELLTDLMNDLWSRLDGVIRDHGGRVDKHIGDAVMAVWGSNGTREDDPERAVCAALALQESLAIFTSETGQQVGMRVGVNTGPALIAAAGTDTELTAMGDTVNVASRLEGTAPLGGVLVSHDTYRHLRGVFDVDPLPAMSLKGKAEPIRVYVVQQAKPRAFRLPSRGVEGVETRTIGRDDELATLQGAFTSVLGGSGSRCITVIGDAGVGKSRLLDEFQAWLELRPEPIWLLKGRALPSRQGMALGLVRDVLADRFHLLDSDSPAELTAKLREGLSPTLGAVESDVVGTWLGFDLAGSDAVHRRVAASQLAAVATAHIVRWLTALAATSPTVLFLEDLHWADGDSLELIRDVASRVQDSHLLVVALARPELAERGPRWFDDLPLHVRIDLAPLGGSATASLVREVLQQLGAVPRSLVELIVERAEGNPYFVEELIKMLIDDGTIRTDGPGGAWAVDMGRLDRNRVPATLTGVLQARLDNLDERERSALQSASVVGRVFWDDALRSTVAEREESLSTTLEALREREIVFRRDRSRFEGCDEFIFKHALLRDVTYETVLLRDRRLLHGRVARWLTERAGDRLGEYLDNIAEHHLLAGEEAAAAACLHRAGQAALRRGLVTSARQSLERALALVERVGAEVPPGIFTLLGEACSRLGEFEKAATALRTAAEAEADPAQRLEALRQLSKVASERGDHVEERALLDRALALGELTGAASTGVLIGLAWWELGHGDVQEGQRHAEAALRAAEAGESVPEMVEANHVLGALAATQDDFDRAGHHLRACAELAQRGGDLTAEAFAYVNVGVLSHLRADSTGVTEGYRLAVGYYEKGLALLRTLGDRIGAATASLNAAQALLRLGDTRQAHGPILDSMRAFAGLGARSRLLFAVLVEADRRLMEGDVDAALPLLGVVRDDPAVERQCLEEIGRILSRVRVEPDVIRCGLDRGAALDVDEVVAHLCSGSDRGADEP